MKNNIGRGSSGKRIQLLHVDDDESFLKISKLYIEKLEQNIEVTSLSDSLQVSTILERHKYDVIISDYQMPGKNGLQLLENLRSSGNTIPFIILTGKGRDCYLCGY
ncbi:MAG: response regulator [Candidatus Hodarchaeota archaeon]